MKRAKFQVRSAKFQAASGLSPARRICRKETRESALWLRLLSDTNDLDRSQADTIDSLLAETTELTRIFTAIILKREPH